MSRETDAAEMKRMLQYMSQTKVAAQLKVKRQSVNSWAKGEDVTPTRLGQVRALLKESLGRKRTPPQSFDWDGLMESVKKIEATVLALSAEERLLGPEIAAAGRRSTLGDDAPPGEEEPRAPAPYGSEPQPGQ